MFQSIWQILPINGIQKLGGIEKLSPSIIIFFPFIFQTLVQSDEKLFLFRFVCANDKSFCGKKFLEDLMTEMQIFISETGHPNHFIKGIYVFRFYDFSQHLLKGNSLHSAVTVQFHSFQFKSEQRKDFFDRFPPKILNSIAKRIPALPDSIQIYVFLHQIAFL